MKVKGIFNGRKKKRQNDDTKLLKNTSTHEESTLPSNNSGDHLDSISLSSEEEQPTNGFVLRKYSENVNGSAMSMFARMSTTIAETLSEKEFGNQKNCLYRPNTNSYPSKVVHPVLCKRDIFVKSVTPTKPKGRRTRPLSIYHVDDKESYMIKEKQNRDTTKTKTKIEIEMPFEKALRPKQNIQGNCTKKQIMVKKEAESRQQNETTTTDYGTQDQSRSKPVSYSISASMLFRQRKQLSVETGRITSDEGQLLANRDRLYYGQQGDHNQYLKFSRESSRPPRFAGAPVSPSSTVSSLTIPAELDFDPTPKALFHQQLKSPPQLEGIQEQSDCDDVTRAQIHLVEDKEKTSEI